ncbi:alpha/beta hydrolase [Bifidobacterium choloepi]|uniref:Alpha/beta hydrolase n=1 Tax=Bifidobacterium choloepi TaxID=2614131 RepID=A0A6I5N0R9_9BIFI|nr:alpha/beta hydrolase [Bifidobacterium choloepi]NEG70518.1 alpha/beta hydrolase [Bifidobacterium choloepi]
MLYFEEPVKGIDHTEATLFGYVPSNSPEIDVKRTRPTVLILPGGGYEMTSDREAEPIAIQYLAAGFNAFVLHYSCSPSTYPTQLLEVAAAMRLLHDNAVEWHVDADRIAVVGFSAGGHLAANFATSAGDDVERQYGYDPDELRPAALLLAYPVVTAGEFAHRGSFDALLGDKNKNDSSALDAVSIEKHIDAKTPPVFVWHTVTDDTVPVENTLQLIAACHAADVPVEAHLYPHGGHGLSLGTIETAWQGNPEAVEPCVQSWFSLSIDWLHRTLD